MVKEFGEWVNDMAGSIEDKSDFMKPATNTVQPVTDLEQVRKNIAQALYQRIGCDFKSMSDCRYFFMKYVYACIGDTLPQKSIKFDPALDYKFIVHILKREYNLGGDKNG